MSIYNELKRRNVIKVAIAYAVIAWVTFLGPIGQVLRLQESTDDNELICVQAPPFIAVWPRVPRLSLLVLPSTNHPRFVSDSHLGRPAGLISARNSAYNRD